MLGDVAGAFAPAATTPAPDTDPYTHLGTQFGVQDYEFIGNGPDAQLETGLHR